jgi:hypothetical protein
MCVRGSLGTIDPLLGRSFVPPNSGADTLSQHWKARESFAPKSGWLPQAETSFTGCGTNAAERGKQKRAKLLEFN